MSLYARKVDANQAQVVAALRAVGVLVESRLSRVGGGVPDLLCGYAGKLFLLEVKDGAKSKSKRGLTPDERTWHEQWEGFPVFMVESAAEAVLVVTGKLVEVKP